MSGRPGGPGGNRSPCQSFVQRKSQRRQTKIEKTAKGKEKTVKRTRFIMMVHGEILNFQPFYKKPEIRTL
jgi:hypothetical protein